MSDESDREACRNDGRCQYAIDHGAEGLGHCPKGKCAYAVKTVVDNISDSLGEMVSRALISKEYFRSTIMGESQREAIQADAERAAQERQTPNVACNHPFSSEQGRYWVACYQAEWDRLYSRSYDEGQGLGGCGFETYHEERRGK